MSTWLESQSHQNRSRRESRRQLQLYAGKRTLDVTLASILLVVVFPVMVAAFVAVRVSSPGGAVFRQVRVGALGRPFVLLKFRTMSDGCSEESHQRFVRQMMAGDIPPPGDGVYKLHHDPRVTAVGRFLRRTSIDELPQLVNVLRGDMSMVGPRPPLPWEVELFPVSAACRFLVPPGLTGLWQISGRNRLTMLEGLQLDVVYAGRCSLSTDLLIVCFTPWCLLHRGVR